MSYRTPEPPIEAFQDVAQQILVRRLMERLKNLELVTQSHSQGPSGRLAPAPPLAKLGVTVNTNIKGHVYVRILNPEFQGGRQNQAGSPIRHWLRASPSPQFKTGVVDFGISHQTYYDVSELGSGPCHFEVKSTFDGQTFNRPRRSGKVVIP
jgi:hypothetical protein